MDRESLESAYRAAFFLTASRIDATRLVEQTLSVVALARYEPTTRTLLGVMARQVEKEPAKRTARAMDELIQLRSESVTVKRPPAGVLAWECKRHCLSRVLGTLTGACRSTFVLSHIFAIAPSEAAALLEIQESAFRVRLSRALRRVEEFLAPRCEHVTRENPCSCEDVGVAWLEGGHLDYLWDHDTPPTNYAADGPIPDVPLLFRRLPAPRLTEQEIERLLGMG